VVRDKKKLIIKRRLKVLKVIHMVKEDIMIKKGKPTELNKPRN
jgi:hypothetical protein